jgi:hypothetical protein
MNIDSLPLTAFALEASGAAAQAVGSVHTLTLKAAAAPEAVAGILTLPCGERRGVTVLPGQPAPTLVLTF